MRIPSHTTVAAYGALFIALSTGGAYAANELAPNSVGTSQIRNGSVRVQDLARNARPPSRASIADTVTSVLADPNLPVTVNVHATDGAPGPVGPQGPQGDPVVGPQGPQGVQGDKGTQGDQGIPGGLWAYGAINANGTGTVSGFNVTHPSTGIYCLDTSSATFHVATATPYGDGAAVTLAHIALAPNSGACAGKSVQVTINDTSSTLADMPFYFMGT